MAETKKNIGEVIAPAMPTVEKEVTIKIPREKGVEEDVVVWVNNRRFLIQRGVPVSVPESVALILEQQEKMLQYCYEYESKVSK